MRCSDLILAAGIVTGLAGATVGNAASGPAYQFNPMPVWTIPAQYSGALDRARAAENALQLGFYGRRQVQSDLTALGFDPGPVDGIFGRLTRYAIRDWQRSVRAWDSGFLTGSQVSVLRDRARRVASDRRFWTQSGAVWGNLDGMRQYLERYPGGLYADTARERLRERKTADRIARERDDWQQARTRNTARAYRHYLERYPDGLYARDARTRLRQFDEAELTRADRAYWQRVRDADTAAAYQSYLARYPRGQYAQQARERLRILDRQGKKQNAPDLVAWRAARDANTIAAFREFLRKYPDSGKADEARSRLNTLLAERSDGKQAGERKAWRQARNVHTVAGYESFLRRYPNGEFAQAARREITGLTKSVSAPLAETPRQVEDRLIDTPQKKEQLIRGLYLMGYLKEPLPDEITPKVRDAIRWMQRKRGLPVTGFVSPKGWGPVHAIATKRP